MDVDGKRQRASMSTPRTLVSPRLRLPWKMSMIRPGHPGHVPSGAARVTRKPNLFRSPRMAAGVTPKTTVFFRSTDHRSTPNEMLGVGSRTMPTVRLSDSSGLRFGLPPSVIGN